MQVENWGTLPYAEALERQYTYVQRRRSGELSADTLCFVQHPPVYTVGTRPGAQLHLKLSPAELAAQGVQLEKVSRGGDITYHGPGQLVGYVFCNLDDANAQAPEGKGAGIHEGAFKPENGCASAADMPLNRSKSIHSVKPFKPKDLHAYLRYIEAAVCTGLATVGLAGEHAAQQRAGKTGLWVGGTRKIAAIGVAARGWVTYHGFAVNITQACLPGFTGIVPCGIAPAEGSVTCLEHELSAAGQPPVSITAVQAAIADAFVASYATGAPQ